MPPSAGLAYVLVIQILSKPPNNASIRNDYCAVARRHQFPFLIPHDESDEIGAWFDVETRLDGDARTVEALESGVEQLHFENFFAAGYEIPIFIENDRSESDIVMIATIHFAKFQGFQVQVSENREPDLRLVLAKKLSLKVHGQVTDFFLRKNGFLDFLFGSFFGSLQRARSVIAATRLNVEFLLAGQTNFQSVEAAVQLEILRGKAEQIGCSGSSCGFAQCDVKIVSVVKEGAASAKREIVKDFALRRLSLDSIAGFVTGGPKRIPRRISDIAHNIRGVQTTRVHRVDDHTSAVRTVNDIDPIRQQ